MQGFKFSQQVLERKLLVRVRQPANFLDGGGGATAENVQAALGVVSSDPDAKAIFINSFGGLTKMDLIAQGLVDFISAKEKDGETLPPIVARLRGTGEEEAAEIVRTRIGVHNMQASLTWLFPLSS